MKKLKIAFKMVIERLAFYMLKKCGTMVVIYPIHMELYHDEILGLCRQEEVQTYSTDDILGAGYFRGRRVMSMMRKKYPALQVRDLWKAVDFCSQEIKDVQA